MFSCRNLCLTAARYGNLVQLAVGLCSVDVPELIPLGLMDFNLLTKICYTICKTNQCGFGKRQDDAQFKIRQLDLNCQLQIRNVPQFTCPVPLLLIAHAVHVSTIVKMI